MCTVVHKDTALGSDVDLSWRKQHCWCVLQGYLKGELGHDDEEQRLEMSRQLGTGHIDHLLHRTQRPRSPPAPGVEMSCGHPEAVEASVETR